jgi:SAM-dependent methyltransferase
MNTPDAAAEATRRHYERYPYPRVEGVDWSPFALDQVNFTLGRGPADAIPANARVLVAGCGTRDAVTWALAVPDGEVLAIDFSRPSLDASAALAAQIGITNLRHEVRDIMTLRPGDLGEPFDLIVSFGVVHHLADPPRGLANLRALLGPEGALLLMVYSTTHRRAVREMDGIAAAIAGPDATAEQRVAALLELGRELGEFPGPLREAFGALLEQAEDDVPGLMDTFGHPNYHTYSIDELWALLADAGLRFAAWAIPGQWRAGHALGDSAAAAALDALPTPRRWDVLDRLFAPLFIFYAEHRDRASSGASPWEAADLGLLNLALRPAVRHRIAVGADGRIEARETYGPSLSVADGVASVSLLPGLAYEDHPLLVPWLQALDGERTAGAAAELVSRQTGAPPDAVRALAARATRWLLSPHEALVVVPRQP